MKYKKHNLPITFILLTLICSISANEREDLKAYDSYWQQVQEARNDYDDAVGSIQRKYPDLDTNPQAQDELQQARKQFSDKRSSIEKKNSSVATNSDLEKKYWSQKHSNYKQKHDTAEKRFRSRINSIKEKYPDPAQNPLARHLIQQATKEYNDTSKHLAVQHQKDLQDMIRDEIGKETKGGTHKTSAPEKTTAGTGIYKKDPKTGAILRDSSGKPIPNPNYRGFEGDYDGEAGSRAADPDKIKKILQKKGLGDVSVDDRPGYLTIGDGKDGINLTLNKAGESMGEPGSSGHDARVTVDAESKETYVSAKMKNNQPGKSYVEVQDHKKKAMKGLKSDPKELLGDSNSLQGMAKGVSKSITSAGMDDSDEDIIAVLIKNDLYKPKYPESSDREQEERKRAVNSFKSKMNALKSGQAIAPEGVGIDESNIKKYQQASRDIIEKAENKTANQRDTDYENTRKQINDLSKSDDPEDKAKAQQFRKDLADSQRRSLAAKRANERREAGEDLTPPETTRRKTGDTKTTQNEDTKTISHSSEGEARNWKGGITKRETTGKFVKKESGTTVTTSTDKTTETGISGTETTEKRTQKTKLPGGASSTRETTTKTKRGVTGTETSESTKVTNTTSGGYSKEKETTTTTKSGPSGEETSTTKTTTTTDSDGNSESTSNTKTKKAGWLEGETKTESNTTSTKRADGSGRSKTESKTTESGPIGTGKTTTETNRTKTQGDGSEVTSGRKTENTTIGGRTVIQKDTKSVSKSNTVDVDVVDSDGNVINKSSIKTTGNTEKETTKIGGKEVGRKTTKKVTVSGKFDRDAPDDQEQPKSGTDFKIKIADNMTTDEGAKVTKQAGGTEKVGDAEFSATGKGEYRHHKTEYGTTISIDKSGNIVTEHKVHGEYNLIRLTSSGKGTANFGDSKVTLEVAGESKVGVNATLESKTSVSTQKVKFELKGGGFAGWKNEGQISTEFDCRKSLGIVAKGTVKGELNVGVGAEGEADFEIGFSGVKLNLGGSVTTGVGGGVSSTIEVDVSTLTLGVDLTAVAESDAEQKIISQLIKQTKTHQVILPEGKKWSEVLPRIRKLIEWAKKNPGKVPYGKEAEAIMAELGFRQGKNYGKFVNVKKRQQDWYCTNRPQISAPVDIPPVVISWRQRMKDAGFSDDEI